MKNTTNIAVDMGEMEHLSKPNWSGTTEINTEILQRDGNRSTTSAIILLDMYP